jgi:hypothetical protein
MPNLKSLVVKDGNLPWILGSSRTLDSRDLALQRVRPTLPSRIQELSVFHDREIISSVVLEEMPNLKMLNIDQRKFTRRWTRARPTTLTGTLLPSLETFQVFGGETSLELVARPARRLS